MSHIVWLIIMLLWRIIVCSGGISMIWTWLNTLPSLSGVRKISNSLSWSFWSWQSHHAHNIHIAPFHSTEGWSSWHWQSAGWSSLRFSCSFQWCSTTVLCLNMFVIFLHSFLLGSFTKWFWSSWVWFHSWLSCVFNYTQISWSNNTGLSSWLRD